ncbi:predicted protein [Plenodomus lingam JN3]|uniref:Predicted protein n=1 Tax=Leptosphaeria maculans (strain JN3 / isolate v23.1.3 / race Av1-4-5-6-7-8) TaxID=985895 RepID=E5ABP5_LEPMJ|nr:predicted protein [Plenodomus lingam JN3]CBY01086.1 predicted protein [Plenodomus lingam JN3]
MSFANVTDKVASDVLDIMVLLQGQVPVDLKTTNGGQNSILISIG